MSVKRQPLCDCELPGAFCSGVPGVLAWMENGRVAPGARVERCDACQQFDSDQAARAKLVELGLAESQESAGSTFTVQCLAIVRVTQRGIAAGNQREAAELARERFDWQRDQATAVFTGDFDEFVVHNESDADDSRRFTDLLKEITA